MNSKAKALKSKLKSEGSTIKKTSSYGGDTRFHVHNANVQKRYDHEDLMKKRRGEIETLHNKVKQLKGK